MTAVKFSRLLKFTAFGREDLMIMEYDGRGCPDALIVVMVRRPTPLDSRRLNCILR